MSGDPGAPAVRAAFGETFTLPPGYLNTARTGVPPSATARAVRQSVEDWCRARPATEPGDSAIAASRSGFATVIGVAAEQVAIGPSVSSLVGLVAASLPAGTRVLVARNEFSSLSWPFAAQHERGVRLTEVALDKLPAHADRHDLIAVSVVQPASGAVVDLDALRSVARPGTRFLLDVTQAAGWLPLELGWADIVVATGHKWLLSPRGAAWMALRPDAGDAITPHAANWFAAPCSGVELGMPPLLGPGARRFDHSPIWMAHVGAAHALRWLGSLPRERVHRYCLELADRFTGALDLASTGSAIVTVARRGAAEALARAGIAATGQGDRVRLSFHLYNTVEDVDQAVQALDPR